MDGTTQTDDDGLYHFIRHRDYPDRYCRVPVFKKEFFKPLSSIIELSISNSINVSEKGLHVVIKLLLLA